MIGAKIRFFKVNIYSSADLVTCCDVSDKALATRVVIGVYSTWVTWIIQAGIAHLNSLPAVITG